MHAYNFVCLYMSRIYCMIKGGEGVSFAALSRYSHGWPG